MAVTLLWLRGEPRAIRGVRTFEIGAVGKVRMALVSGEVTLSKNENAAGEQPGNDTQATHKKKRLVLACVVAVVVAAAIGGGAYWYTNYQVPRQQAIEAFNVACDGLESRTVKVDEAIAEIQELQAGDDKPLDESVDMAASSAVGQAQAAKESAPDMPDGTDEINAAAEAVSKMGDYSETLASLASAKQALQDSIAQLKQVTNPTGAFVIQRLTGLANITGVEAVTETNDPNGNLNKAGGYTAAVYFSSDLVDQSGVYPSEGYTGLVAAGCDGGGCVEVYATVEYATKRNDYLSAFDGSILSSGSHEVLGTCVIRTSNLLTASQQQSLAGEIRDALVRL